MRLKYFAIIILLSMGLVRCASKPQKPPEVPDVTDSASTENPTNEPIAPGETSEKDLQALSNSPGNDEFGNNQAPVVNNPEPTPPGPDMAQNNPPPVENIPEAAQPPPPATLEPSAPVVNNDKPAIVTGLDFKAGENGGTIVVKTNREVTFTTRKNDKNNQFVVELDNTRVPKKFRRPYNTKEFPGAIASITAYQGKGAKNSARIVVQLRDSAEPGVTQDGKTINIAAAGGGAAPAPNAQTAENNTPAPEPQAEAEAPQEQATQGEQLADNDNRIMSNKSFDSFLLGQNKFYGHPINIEVSDQNVREVFKFISEETGLNIILDDDVTGKITMKLKAVPWDQALAIILQSKQLGYVKNGSILRIASLKTLSTESTTARQVIDAQKNLQSLRVQVYPISYAKADDLTTQIKDLLTPLRGKATADKRTNTVVVTDIPEVLSKIKTLVAKLDTQTPQVLIEAKIVEVKDTASKSIGVNWNATGQSSKIGQGAGQRDLTAQPTADFQFAGVAATNSLGLTVGNLDVLGNLATTLKFLESEDQIKIISSPRIVALDRVEATIEQTTQLPNFSSTINTTTGVQSTSITFQDFKLQLKVTPQITVDGGISMKVDVLREFPGTVQGGASATSYPSNKRHAATEVLVENGDTVVIGGIYQSDIEIQETGIPWLRKLPLIGWLFGGKDSSNQKNELVIFLSPRILNREKAFVKADEAM